MARIRAETLHALVLVALSIGLAFSVFAWYESVNPATEKVCTVNPFVSCSKVDQSSHTTTLGIQDYYWGIAGFVAMLALDIPLFRSWDRRLLEGLTVLSGLGLALSVYFAYVELVVIQGLCLICLGSYLSNVVAFAGLVTLVRMGRRERAAAAKETASAEAARAE